MIRPLHDTLLDSPTFILRADGLRRCLGPMVISLMISWGGSAAAISTVSIDVDPIAAEPQVERTVRIGEIFEVDVLIHEDSVNPGAAAASAFEFDLLFDASRIAVTRVLLGSVLAAPAIGFVDEVGPGLVGFSAVSLSSDEGARSGQLARVTLQAVGLGGTSLGLENVLVSAPSGGELATLIGGGSIEVVAVPEAGTGALVLGGLCSMGWGARRRLVARSI